MINKYLLKIIILTVCLHKYAQASPTQEHIEQFFNYLTFLGDPEHEIDFYSVQSFMTCDCTIQSNNIIISQGIEEFIAYIHRMQNKYENVSYSSFLENLLIFENKAAFHFQVQCIEKNGLQRNLEAIALVIFQEGKISYWKEVFCEMQPQNTSKEFSLNHLYEEPHFDHHLYPITAPFREGFLTVSKIHTIFYATYGNPKGIPIVILHGGPGEGCCDELTQFFDLKRYYVIMLDQRGSKRSIPFASMEENTPSHSVADIETLRKHLGIEKWLVFGGSWGSTLAILYGQSHPEHCQGFILRGIFLGREQDYLHLLYGMGKLAPNGYEKFLGHIPEEEHSDLLSAYYARIIDPNPEIHMPAARAFMEFDAACVRFSPNPLLVENVLKNDQYIYSVTKHFLHYSINQFFLKPDQILSNMNKIKHLPAIIIHGKYDIVTLPENAYALYRKWDNSTLWMIRQGGHTSTEYSNAAALATALDFFADKIAR